MAISGLRVRIGADKVSKTLRDENGEPVVEEAGKVSFGTLLPSGGGNAYMNVVYRDVQTLTALRDAITSYLESGGNPAVEFALGNELHAAGKRSITLPPGTTAGNLAERAKDIAASKAAAAAKTAPAKTAPAAKGIAKAALDLL